MATRPVTCTATLLEGRKTHNGIECVTGSGFEGVGYACGLRHRRDSTSLEWTALGTPSDPRSGLTALADRWAPSALPGARAPAPAAPKRADRLRHAIVIGVNSTRPEDPGRSPEGSAARPWVAWESTGMNSSEGITGLRGRGLFRAPRSSGPARRRKAASVTPPGHLTAPSLSRVDGADLNVPLT